MKNIDDKKTEEEVKLLKIEQKIAKAKLYLELSKAIALFFGAIVVFWFIQQPESILNRASSKETIARERAKLMLELIKEDDPQKQTNALAVIKAAYGESNNEWLRKLEKRLQSKAETSAVKKLLAEHAEYVKRKYILEEELHVEMTGANGGERGRGPRYASSVRKLTVIEFKIKKIVEQLASYGLDVTKVGK